MSKSKPWSTRCIFLKVEVGHLRSTRGILHYNVGIIGRLGVNFTSNEEPAINGRLGLTSPVTQNRPSTVEDEYTSMSGVWNVHMGHITLSIEYGYNDSLDRRGGYFTRSCTGHLWSTRCILHQITETGLQWSTRCILHQIIEAGHQWSTRCILHQIIEAGHLWSTQCILHQITEAGHQWSTRWNLQTGESTRMGQ